MNSTRLARGPLFVALPVAVLLAAALLRLEDFASLPPGTHPDIGQYVSDGLRISRVGAFPLHFDTYPEPLWRFILGVAIWWTQAAPFTERLTGGAVGLLTVAVTLRAALDLLKLDLKLSPAARHVGALGAAVTVTSIVALQFMNRQGYRASLLPLAVGFTLLMFARAWRTRTIRNFGLAGFAAGFPINTYTSGLIIPVAALGVLVYMIVLAPKSARPDARLIGVFLVGLFFGIAPQLALYAAVPDLYSRIAGAQTYGASETIQPLFTSVPDLLQRLETSLSAIFNPAHRYAYPNYNARDIAFLNPFLAIFVAIGWIASISYSRRSSASLWFPLLTGILLASILPAMFSVNPDNPLRASGTFLPLAMLAGIGFAWVSEHLSLRKSIHVALRSVVLAAILLGLAYSIVAARTAFRNHWKAQDWWEQPEYWLSIPAYFSVGYFDLLHMLHDVEEPVYFPVRQVNTPLGAWYLWSQPYPHITAPEYDPQDGIDALPAGEVWIPRIAEYNVPLTDAPEHFVLLTPGENGRDGTMTFIPPVPDQTAADLVEYVKREGTPIIDPNYGWTLGWRMPISDGISGISSAPSPDKWHPVGAIYDSRLELVGYEAPQTLVPGQTTRFTLYWRVLRPIKYDIFSFGVLLSSDHTVTARSNDTWMYRWVHPSPFWQPGEIVPDVRDFTIPEDAPPGAYSLLVGLYKPPGTAIQLSMTDANGQKVPDSFLPLTNHRVPIEPVQLPSTINAVGAQFGSELEFEGYTTDTDLTLEAARPGDTISLVTYWRAIERPLRDYTFFIHIEDESGIIVAQSDLRPERGTYPTNIWSPGEQVPVTFTITLPETLESEVRWFLGVYSFPSLDRLPITVQNEQTPDNRLEIN